MDGRIGALHLQYRTRNSTIATALASSMDGRIRTRLEAAIGERLSAVLGDDPTVIVIRELTARATLARMDWSLDGRVVDKISRASAEAVGTILGTSATTDAVVRFQDQAEFISSFIVDLLEGSAWERWYYGAFHRYRQGDVRGTIAAVLADHRPETARVYGWLARRGRLDDLIALLGSRAARQLATADDDDGPEAPAGRDAGPLAAATFELLDALGYPGGDSAARTTLVLRYLATSPIPPTWTDRRSLTAWLLGFARFVVSSSDRRGTLDHAENPETVRGLLAGPLDWLDTAWLAPQLDNLLARTATSQPAPAVPGRSVLANRHQRFLERTAELVRNGRIRIDRTIDRDALIVRLLAAVSADDLGLGPPSRALAAVLERVADGWCALIANDVDAETGIVAIEASPSSPASRASPETALQRHLDAVRAAGPGAVELLRQLAKSVAAVGAAGDPTSGAGLYLLTRGILDVKLGALSREAGVPLEALLAGLAMKWLRLTRPFDGPTALWVGAPHPDLAALDAPTARLADLEQALLDVLVGQRSIDALPADEVLADLPMEGFECSAASNLTLSRMAWMVMRAWSRWLPGISVASMEFVVRNCLQRFGRVRVTTSSVEVQLDPAPLDIVLEMAGYFRPIELVPWLDGRTLVFTVRRAPSA